MLTEPFFRPTNFFENLIFEPLALVEEKMYEIFLFNFPVSTISVSTIPDLTHFKIVVNRTNFLIYLDFSKAKQEIFEEMTKKSCTSNEIEKFLQIS